jgi:hypothetical protein
VALRKPGMSKRHWEKISEEVGEKIKPTEDFTFKEALNFGLLKHVDLCIKVGERAAKEFGIRKMLDEMKDKWKEIKFDLKPYGEE